ncbi:hypothetical protein Trydic_g3148 [Trypoxylus dichotomus]
MFRRHSALGPNVSVPDRKTILLWCCNFQSTISTLTRKSPDRPKTVRTPDNLNAVKTAIRQLPKPFARKHALALGISDQNSRILHANLKRYPYKMVLAQELSERDHVKRRTVSAEILEQVPADDIVLSSDKAHFHL